MSGPGSHSPVGASAIKRVLMCPASVALAAGIVDEESDHAALGTAVHHLIETCMTTDTDAWQHVGSVLGTFAVTPKMANSAQVFVNAVRKAHPDRNQGNFGVERRFHCPDIHPLFFGTTDAWALEPILDPTDDEPGNNVLHIWDYKNGAGVVVEVEHNEQEMYYACGILETLELWDKVEHVVLHIVQPNGFHSDGPVREWATTPDDLAEWLEDVCIPGINAAVTEGVAKATASGEHCRFCPARSHACPQIIADMEELAAMVEEMNKPGAPPLTNEQVGRFLSLFEIAKIASKAANTTAFNRLQAGAKIDGWKLVKGKANRTWKDGADKEAVAEFGNDAFSLPELKSPAQIDDLPLGSAFTARWAAKPDVGLTLAKAADPRPEVSPDTKSMFTPVVPAAPVAPAAPVPPTTPARRRKPALATV